MNTENYDAGGSRRLTFPGARDVLTYYEIDCKTDEDIDNNNSWHKNAWRKLPKMGKKSFEGWPVREVANGHVSSRPTSRPIGNAFPNGHKRHPNITEVMEGYSEYGLVPTAQRMPSPQSEKAPQFTPESCLTSQVSPNGSPQIPKIGPVSLLRR
jgi:hypothetical protein